MDKIIIVMTTFSKKEDARVVAKALLEKKLVACAQISAEIESLYWWKDEIEKSGEYVLSLKTIEDAYSQVEQLVQQIHPYETPEIICVQLSHVDSEYRKWLCGEIDL